MPKRPVEARVLAAVAADEPAGELGGSYPLLGFGVPIGYVS